MSANFRNLFFSVGLVLVFSTSASAQLPDVIGQVVQGAGQVINEGSKIIRDVLPIQISNGQVIVNTPTDSYIIDPATGRTIANPSPLRRTVENFPGIAMCQGVRAAKSSVRTRYALPRDVAIDLIQAGVPASVVQRVSWSPDWYATNYMPGTGNMAAVTIEDVILVRDNRFVGDRALMAHELKHVQQYDRLGTDAFCSQYTTNSWIFESEAKDEEARVGRVLASLGSPTNGGFVGPQPGFQQQFGTYYSYCATPAGNSQTIIGGFPNGSGCSMPTAWGNVQGTVVGFYR